MPRNSSGVYTLPVPTFTAGEVFESADANSNFSDIATALTQSLATTGVSSMTGPVKLIAGSINGLSCRFDSDESSGFYLISSRTLGLSIDNTLIVSFNTLLTTFFTVDVINNTGGVILDNSNLNIGQGDVDVIDDYTVASGDVTTLTGALVDKDGNDVFAYPIGAILEFGATVEPDRWLFCNGQAVSRTTYSALFAVLSTRFGAGDGSTTFNVPDMRGRVGAGDDSMGASSAGRLSGGTIGAGLGDQVHTLLEGEMAIHVHTYNQRAFSFLALAGGVQACVTSLSTNTSTVGSGDAHNNVQPTLVCYNIIYAGV